MTSFPNPFLYRLRQAFGRSACLFFLLGMGLFCQAQPLKSTSTLNRASLVSVTSELQRPVDFIVAVVNSEPVTNNEVLSRYTKVEQQLKQQGAALPARSELLRDLLERIIVERAQLQLAREFGLRVEDNQLEQALQGIARQNQLTLEQLRSKLTASADGNAYERLKSGLRDEMLLVRIREREVDAHIKVTDQEITQFIAEQAAASKSADLDIDLAQILIAVPEKASPAQVATLQAKAQQALQRLQAGADFVDLSKELSDAPNRLTGGQMGLRSVQRYPSLFIDAVQNVPVGGLSAVIRSEAGFHVLKVLDKKSSGSSDTYIVQTRARHILLRPDAQLNEATAKARLADFKKRIQARQTDFATLASENGQDGSAANGGDLGWASPGMFVPEFEEVMNRLSPGQISDPLVSRFGVHLIQVLERRSVKLSPQEQRELVRNLIREKKLDAEYATWAREVRGRAYVEYREAPGP